jgi:3-oxosteroid 1-dehydrogenase
LDKQEYDVVVIGSGVAGLAAALAAAEMGQRVVVYEKAAKLGGGTAACWWSARTAPRRCPS